MAPRRRRSSSRGRSPGPPQREHQLPVEAANDMLAGFKGRLHSVKTQDLKLEDGSSITIARVKVPVPKGVSGHLIKRFDTGAISASSLYRVAYPAAKEEEELAEMRFLSKAYDTRGAGAEEADGTGKLTGTWVPVADATTLAKEYGLTKFASELIDFEQTEGQSSNNGAISSPAAPTPRKSKSPAPPPSSASQRSKRARVTSPPAVPATRASTATQSLAPPSPAKPASKRGRGRQSAAAKAAAEQQDDAESVATNDTKDGEVVTGGVQITQEIITDQTTGEVLEETKVTFASADGESNGLIGSNEQAEKAIADAKQLIDSLKQDGVLQSGTSSTKRAREDDDNAEEEEENDRPGIVSRFFGRKQRSKRRTGEADTLGELQVLQSPDGIQVLVASSPALQPQPNRRRFIAMAGMVVMGAATAAAPYFFN